MMMMSLCCLWRSERWWCECSYLARFLDEGKARVDEPVEHGKDAAEMFFSLQRLGQSVEPRLEHWTPAESARLQVDHTTPTHRRRLNSSIHTRIQSSNSDRQCLCRWIERTSLHGLAATSPTCLAADLSVLLAPTSASPCAVFILVFLCIMSTTFIINNNK